MDIVVIIPAYKPKQNVLYRIVRKISTFNVAKVVVVDDGSGHECSGVFSRLQHIKKTVVLHHGANQGKGAALRTGFRYIMNRKLSCSGIVTVDADGQHLPKDVEKIIHSLSLNDDTLVLGVRRFSTDVPLRSFMGNKITCLMFKGLVGINFTDTQTGLRGIPVFLVPYLLDLKSNRYEYELEMLLTLIEKGVKIHEIPIDTLYEDNNAGSSFRPVSDAIRIYKVLFSWWFTFRFKQIVKYALSGIFSTVADFGTYIILINLSCGFVTASILARILSMMIHFSSNKYFTFSYRELPQFSEIMKYFVVVGFNLISSIFLIYIFISFMFLGEVLSKVAAQLILFFITYALMNGFVFLENRKHKRR